MKANMLRQWTLSIVILLSAVMCMVMLLCETSHAETDLDMGNATAINLGSQYAGTAIPDGNNDFAQTFVFTTSGNDSFYEIELINSTCDEDLECTLYNSDGVEYDPAYSYNLPTIYYVGTHSSKIGTGKLQPNSKYFLFVRCSYLQSYGDYKLKVTEIPDDAGDNSYVAKTISVGKSYNGRIAPRQDEDWYRFVASKTGVHTITLMNKNATQLEITTYDENIVMRDRDYWVYSNNKTSIAVKLRKGEVHYFRIKDYAGDYKVSVKGPTPKKPSKVVWKSVKAGKKTLKVKYKTAKNTTKYQIAIKRNGASKWKYYSSKKTTKTIKKLKTGKKYKVKVRGIRVVDGKNYYGKWSTTRTVKVK